jgi:hypothetical protein
MTTEGGKEMGGQVSELTKVAGSVRADGRSPFFGVPQNKRTLVGWPRGQVQVLCRNEYFATGFVDTADESLQLMALTDGEHWFPGECVHRVIRRVSWWRRFCWWVRYGN